MYCISVLLYYGCIVYAAGGKVLILLQKRYICKRALCAWRCKYSGYASTVLQQVSALHNYQSVTPFRVLVSIPAQKIHQKKEGYATCRVPYTFLGIVGT